MQRVTVSVIPGNWTITLKAYGKKHGDQTEREIALRAMGSTNILVRSGQNESAVVEMVTTTEITDWDDFVVAVSGDPYNDREEIIIIKNDLTVTEMARINRKITILTDGVPVTVKRGDYFGQQFFYIDPNARLVLGKEGLAPGMLVFDGNDGEMGVTVSKAIITFYSAGTVIMNDGVRITKNSNNYKLGPAAGGGVEMTNGTFIMNGGEITRNSAARGGGVYINASLESATTFTMNGGYITNNYVNFDGGGVYMQGGSYPQTFTITKGTISDNFANVFGHGLFIGYGSTFINNGGTISDDINYGEDPH
jgi:hypothetical protein